MEAPVFSFKHGIESPKGKTHVPTPDDSRRGRRHRDEEMDFEGKCLAIIQSFTFVLLNVGEQKIRGYVFARTDYLIIVLEYKTRYTMFLDSPI